MCDEIGGALDLFGGNDVGHVRVGCFIASLDELLKFTMYGGSSRLRSFDKALELGVLTELMGRTFDPKGPEHFAEHVEAIIVPIRVECRGNEFAGRATR